ncbi:cutinase-domain-containing protein [Microdochium bolleyi]|uniref:cutinase n=1 Tax=Microdochium bolleyi TaxID=196109 RepID=A0A136IZW0_9PEZI|nr:cutinase-domain-containing protein [Microdochium bolleyi]
MKFSAATVALLATAVTASPLGEPLGERAAPEAGFLEVAATSGYDARATNTLNEFSSGGCRPYIFFFARGTNQGGNIGDNPGPQVIAAVKATLGDANVAGQGVAYSASLLGNLNSGGAPANEARSFAQAITSATTQCASSKIFVSGYSQGAALVHRAVEQLSTAVKAKVAAAVTFGDTQKKQDGGRIPSFDPSKTLIICHTGDLVCEGTLIITGAHSNYADTADQAARFIVSKA